MKFEALNAFTEIKIGVMQFANEIKNVFFQISTDIASFFIEIVSAAERAIQRVRTGAEQAGLLLKAGGIGEALRDPVGFSLKFGAIEQRGRRGLDDVHDRLKAIRDDEGRRQQDAGADLASNADRMRREVQGARDEWLAAVKAAEDARREVDEAPTARSNLFTPVAAQATAAAETRALTSIDARSALGIAALASLGGGTINERMLEESQEQTSLLEDIEENTGELQNAQIGPGLGDF
jgi:hypothetical protein